MYENEQNIERDKAADKLANASFVLGIISIFSVFCCCPFVISAIGIVLSLSSKGAEKILRPKAKTGLTLSIIGLVTSLVVTVFTIAFPIVMGELNPEFKEYFSEQFHDALEENEDMYRQMYGDDVYEQMEEMF